MSPLPVIICGKSEQIAASVIANLKPEYEVVHLILSPEAGTAQIPLLLSGQSAPSDSELGSKNYSATPIAVVLGGGYEDDDAAIMIKAVSENSAAKPVPWLRADTTKPAPPLGPEYGKALVARLKAALGELQEKGELNKFKVHWY